MLTKKKAERIKICTKLAKEWKRKCPWYSFSWYFEDQIRRNLLETISILSNLQIDFYGWQQRWQQWECQQWWFSVYNNNVDDNNCDDNKNGDYNNDDNDGDANKLVMMMSICKRSAADIRASCKSRRDVAAFHFESTSDWQMWATLALNQLAEKAKWSTSIWEKSNLLLSFSIRFLLNNFGIGKVFSLGNICLVTEWVISAISSVLCIRCLSAFQLYLYPLCCPDSEAAVSRLLISVFCPYLHKSRQFAQE